MNILGNPNVEERYSLTSHIIKRWRDRIGYASYQEIKDKIDCIVENGIRYQVDESHYRICFKGICVVFMKLSPLHSLAKTVYYKNEEELSAQ